jgi:hypothetical protein
MKHFLLFLVLFLGLKGYSQYYPFPTSGAVWIDSHGGIMPHVGGPDTWDVCTGPIYPGPDTVINSTTYHTLYRHAVCDWFTIPTMSPFGSYPESTLLYLIWRQDIAQKKVYYFGYGVEVLLYDFGNMAVGQPVPQTINNVNYPDLVVVAYDSLQLVNGEYRERWILGYNYSGTISDSGFAWILEGIGSSMGIVKEIVTPFENEDHLDCFYMNNQSQFFFTTEVNECLINMNVSENETHEFTLFPNPAHEVVQIHLPENENWKSMQIMDIQGKKVFSQQSLSYGPDRFVNLNISAFPEGIYVVILHSESGTRSISRMIKA